MTDNNRYNDSAPVFETVTIDNKLFGINFHCPDCGYSDYELSSFKFNQQRHYTQGDQCCKKQQATPETLLRLQNIELKRSALIQDKKTEERQRNNNGVIAAAVVTLVGFIFPPLLPFGIGGLLLALFFYAKSK